MPKGVRKVVVESTQIPPLPTKAPFPAGGRGATKRVKCPHCGIEKTQSHQPFCADNPSKQKPAWARIAAEEAASKTKAEIAELREELKAQRASKAAEPTPTPAPAVVRGSVDTEAFMRERLQELSRPPSQPVVAAQASAVTEPSKVPAVSPAPAPPAEVKSKRDLSGFLKSKWGMVAIGVGLLGVTLLLIKLFSRSRREPAKTGPQRAEQPKVNPAQVSPVPIPGYGFNPEIGGWVPSPAAGMRRP